MRRISVPPGNEGLDLQAVGFELAEGVVVFDRAIGRLHALNGAAGTIWKALAVGLSVSNATDFMVETYAIGRDQARNDVAQVLDWMTRGCDADHDGRAAADADPVEDDAPEEHLYELGAIGIAVIGPPSEVTRHIAIVLSPHRVAHLAHGIPIRISGGHRRGPFLLHVADKPPRAFDLAEEAIGAVFQAIVELRHPDTHWLGILHGASLSLHGHGILLSAASGSGKSTLTAALSRRGFAYHADDMVALAAPDGAIVPWPAPHSLKRGCWAALADAFPEITHQPIHHHCGRDLRLIAADRKAWDHPPVRSSLLIFPRYEATAIPVRQAITPMEALIRLLEDRLFLGHPVTTEAVEAFLAWLSRIPAYEIVYPDTDTAERLVRDLVAELDPLADKQ
jgi:hypothetical protein